VFEGLGEKKTPGIKILAHYSNYQITVVKSFIKLAPENIKLGWKSCMNKTSSLFWWSVGDEKKVL
jgi:hypothetical protein